MISRTEIDYSLEMIARSKKRLDHQRVVVAKLRFDTEPRYVDLVKDIEATMAAKLSLLLRRHASLVRGEAPGKANDAKSA